jgi:hypothetical protein
VGTVTPRRSRIIEELRRKGLTIHVIQVFGFEDTLKECLSARAILNLHAASDYQIFETARCAFFLDAKVPVISETSLDDDPRAFVFDASKPDIVFQKSLELRGLL